MIDDFLAEKAELEILLVKLLGHSQNHFGLSPEAISFSVVNEIKRLKDDLKRHMEYIGP